MRQTKQKIILQQELLRQTGFWNAEEFYTDITRKHKGIGIATVYRFLKDLEKKGELHSYLCDKRKIYSLGGKKHVHFSCEVCNLKKHITLQKIDFLKEISEEICHLQIDIVGVCKDCSKREI